MFVRHLIFQSVKSDNVHLTGNGLRHESGRRGTLKKPSKDKGSKKMKEFELVSLSNPPGREHFRNPAILRVLPFTPWSVNGKTYLITQASLSLEKAFGTPRKGVALIFDKENGREYALTVEDFHQFMETGDLSLLPKKSICSSKARTIQLKELSLPTVR